ncbi:hypothetical protein ACFOY4_10800 [Actinomadura syzygii]|uniref:SH3 domain-containing protein n=1 Tax=Actinomadura syzygii TaxID=1427538 RepID=A0A5D0U895_9ACTN|nr:hypothetical protein [Actinomadura syzygii]TYC13259.1 hypothetical protein FXF65_22445 [Actinomadura syzygii]
MKNYVRAAVALLVATGAIVAPSVPANASPNSFPPSCPMHYETGQKKFVKGAKAHTGPYGANPVVWVLTRDEYLWVTGWCKNEKGNRWWGLSGGNYVWDGYAA